MAILVADKRRWEKAIEKCKAEKPRVKVLGYARFQVCGSKGDCYEVIWVGKGQEMKATCSCPSGLKNKPCYHVPATSGAFKLQVIERAEKARQDGYTLPSLEEAKAQCEAEKQALLATGWQPDEPSEPNDSALVECCKCGNEYPEAAMTGAGDNAICDDCLMFGPPPEKKETAWDVLGRLTGKHDSSAPVSRMRETE